LTINTLTVFANIGNSDSVVVAFYPGELVT